MVVWSQCVYGGLNGKGITGTDLGDESPVPYCDSSGVVTYICQTLENCILNMHTFYSTQTIS